MKIKIYFIGCLFLISLRSLSFAQSTNKYIIQEIFNRSEGLEINTYALYPENNFKNEFGAVLYPNPVDNLLNVRISGSKGTYISYYLIDISGKLISTKKEINSNFTINMTNLLSGIYLLVINDGTSKKTYKIIKK